MSRAQSRHTDYYLELAQQMANDLLIISRELPQIRRAWETAFCDNQRALSQSGQLKAARKSQAALRKGRKA